LAHEETLGFRVLGPFEVSEGGRPLDVGAGKQRALLALLLLRAGEVVSTDGLIDALWGERPPPSAPNSIHIYVSRLRRALGNGRLETRGHGYVLRLEAEELDLGRFERLLVEGRELLASGDATRAAETLRAALALWRGPPLSDFASEEFAQGDIARLEELRLSALEERIEADLGVGRHRKLVPELDSLVREHPLRERLRAQLMLALYGSGRQAEALETYQQARRTMREELGLEPGRTLQVLERAILRQDADLDPPERASRVAVRAPRRSGALIAIGASVLLAAVVAVAGIELARDDAPPPEVLPNSLVRIDSSTLQPTEVVPIGSGADLIVPAGGYLWITHHVLRDTGTGALRDAGDRTLTRVDPATGDVTTVGGGLAPCGLAADPSGDVWVANCFASGGPTANVVRIDATTLEFEATWPVPPGDGFVRGLAYGGGSLWVSEIFGGDAPPEPPHTVMQVDAQTGEQRSIRLPNPGTPLAWSGGYGDLWICSFPLGSVMRVHTATGDVEVVEGVAFGPTSPVVDGDAVWVGDWHEPQLVRLSAVGSRRARTISLPVQNRAAGVWRVAGGAGHLWATTPRDGALWRVDPKTNEVTRIAIPHLPTGVTADGDDVWVAVRER
jgi:DNA-binding SARP family transcriptional activator/sugar lactone lactonase YvrE